MDQHTTPIEAEFHAEFDALQDKINARFDEIRREMRAQFGTLTRSTGQRLSTRNLKMVVNNG